MMILRLILKILVLPILLAVRVSIFFCTFLVAVSAGVLGFLSALMGIFGVLVIATFSVESGIAVLVLAWLISPAGLPLLAEKLLGLLYVLFDNFKAILCG